MSRERDEQAWTLALKLAQSGRCAGWLDIERELKEQGYSRAKLLLDDEHTRERLDRMCADSRAVAPNA